MSRGRGREEENDDDDEDERPECRMLLASLGSGVIVNYVRQRGTSFAGYPWPARKQ